MEREFPHAPKRAFEQQKSWGRRKIAKRVIALSLVLCAGAFFPYSRSLQSTNEGVSQASTWALDQLGRWFKLEDVSWEEVGASNLSYHVNTELLWSVSGLKPGDSMLSLSLEKLEKKLLSIPWIESVKLQKKLPSSLSVQYSVHQGRALGIRSRKVWVLSSEGHWIARVDAQHPQDADLPLLTEEKTIDKELLWLDTIEQELRPMVLQVHELGVTVKEPRLVALIELKYPSRSVKTTLIAWESPRQETIIRLKRVVQYLIKNNILVSSIDVRAGQKVVVNVGKRL